MATYSTDLTTLTTAEAGTWLDFAAPYDSGTPAASGEQFIQGTDCYSVNTGKNNGLEIAVVFDYGSGYSFATDEVVFAWFYYAFGTNLETYANSGWRFGIGSSDSAWDWFRVGGSNYGSHRYGGWFNFAVDPTATESGTIGGGNGGTYRYFGNVPYTINEVTKGDPVAVDAIRAGRGVISITGTGGSFSELAEYNDYNAGGTPPGTSSTSVDSGYHVLGLFQAAGGSYLWKGLLSLGTSGTSITFSDSNVTIIIDDCPHTYAAFNKIEINNASSSVTWNNVTIISTATTANGVGHFEMVANATFIMNGGAFNDMGTFVFLSNGALTGVGFNGCGQITHGGADFEGCKFLGYEGTADTAYMIYNINADIDGEIDNCSFTKGTAATHAIQFGSTAPDTHTLRGIAFSGYNATNESNDSALYFPDTGADVDWTINLVGCTGSISYKKVRAGDTVTLVINPVTTKIIVRDQTSKSLLVGAAVYVTATAVGDLTEGTVIISGETDSNGEITDSRSLTADQGIEGLAKSGSQAIPYKEGDIAGTIDSSAGTTITILLIRDI